MSNTPIFFDVQTKQALLTLAARMDTLIDSIDRAGVSADRSASRLFWVTVALVVLTIAIAVLTGWLVYDTIYRS